MKRKSGFTLIELVVVVLILGILAGVAAPKMFDTSARATDNSLKTTIAIVRDAIELYAADPDNTATIKGKVPLWTDQATFKTDLAKYIRGTFPSCPVGPAAEKDAIRSIAEATASDGTGGWRYDPATGFFGIHFNGTSASDATITYDDF